MFGKGKKREAITLLIGAGDCEDDWLIKQAKKLNPPKVAKAFEEQLKYEEPKPEPNPKAVKRYGPKNCLKIEQVALSSNGKYIASATNHEVFVFERKTMKQLLRHTLSNFNDRPSIRGICISPSGSKIRALYHAQGNEDKIILAVLSGKGWKQIDRMETKKKDPIAFIAPPSSEWFAVSYFDKKIIVYSKDGDILATLTGKKDVTLHLSASPDGKQLVAADARSGLHIWNTKTWKLAKHLPKFKGRSTVFSAKGDRLVLTGPLNPGNLVYILDARSWKVINSGSIEKQEVWCAALTPDGKGLIAGLDSYISTDEYGITPGELRLLDAKTWEILDQQPNFFDYYTDFIALPEHNALAVSGEHMPGDTTPLVLYKVPT